MTDEIRRLRTELRDLVALSVIPAAWVGREPPMIAAGLADLLMGALRLDFAFVRLFDPISGAAVDVERGSAWKAFPEWLQHHLIAVGQDLHKKVIPDVGGGVGSCRGLVIPVGVNAGGGLVAVASDRTDFPTETDQLLLSVAVNHAATGYQSARLIHERRCAEEKLRKARDELEMKNQILENLSSKLSKYLSPQIYQSIFRGEQTVEISSKRKKLTICFTDIAGFTETTDNLESEELTNVLNHYLTEMSVIALQYGATIDKFIGDAMLLFFGDPESKGVAEDAKACVLMAIAMQRRMHELEQEWRNRGLLRPFRIRMGIATGFCTVGNFGSRDRMEYTIIGNEVNLAARLQSATEPGSILLSHETNALVQGLVMTEEQPPITVKGFPKPISGYKLVGTYDDLVKSGTVMLEERDGLRVLVDLTKQERSDVINILEDILTQLKGPKGRKGRLRSKPAPQERRGGILSSERRM